MSDLEARIRECRQRWDEAPRSRAFIPLADLLRQAGRADEALAVLENGLARHPTAVAGLVTLARALMAAGREPAAAEAAGRALELDPDNLVALELLADDSRRRGEFENAVRHYERLAALAPGDRHWPAALGRVREEQMSCAQDTGPEAEAGFTTLTLADLYLAQGYRQKAELLLRRLAETRPDDPEVMRRLASLPASTATGGPGSGEPPVPAAGSRPQPGAERREQAREQFARWIERIRTEREVTP